jgi:hypothetical protein
VRVVADSHAIYWYLTSPGELSARALEALGEAEDTGGIVVSSWTVPELWMAATRKYGSRSIPRASYELVRATLLDSANAVDIEAFGLAMWPHFDAFGVTTPPAIAVKEGTPVLAWTDSTTESVEVSSFSGGGWSIPVVVGAGVALSSAGPAMTVDGFGDLFAAWKGKSTDNVYLSADSGKGWGTQVQVPGASTASPPAIAW